MSNELTRINLHWNGMYGYKVEGDGEYNSFTGSYVLASDYDAIAAEVERLQQERDQYRQALLDVQVLTQEGFRADLIDDIEEITDKALETYHAESPDPAEHILPPYEG